MMRRWRWSLALVAALATVGLACNGSEEATVADQRLRGQQLEVAAVWTGEEQANFEKVLDLFERRTGAAVRFTSTGRDIATALGSRLDAGDPPDVAILPQPGLLGDLVRREALQSIEGVAGRLVDAK